MTKKLCESQYERQNSRKGYDRPVGVIQNTGQGIVPSGECSKQTEHTTSLDARNVLCAGGVGEDVPEREEQEGHVKREEEEEEGDGRTQRGHEQDGGEDEPAEEEEAEGIAEVLGAGVGSGDVESTGRQGDGDGDPETTVGRESGSTEGVADGHFPAIGLVD